MDFDKKSITDILFTETLCQYTEKSTVHLFTIIFEKLFSILSQK